MRGVAKCHQILSSTDSSIRLAIHSRNQIKMMKLLASLLLLLACVAGISVAQVLLSPAVVAGAPLSNAYTSHYPSAPVVVARPLLQRLIAPHAPAFLY